MTDEPIIERIAQALADRLETITEANGYGLDVGPVTRPPSLYPPAYEHRQVVLCQTDRTAAPSTLGHKTRVQTFELTLVLRPSDKDQTPADTYGNRFAAAVEKCLEADQTWAALADIWALEGPAPTPPESTIEGWQMTLTVTYTTLEKDPFSK